MTTSTKRWLVDGNNVMGSRPDGWWNDRPAAMARLAQEVAQWCWTHDDAVILVFDGFPQSETSSLAGGNLDIHFAERSARNAADDHIVALTKDAINGQRGNEQRGNEQRGDEQRGDEQRSDGEPDYGDRVVTADNGLIARLPPGTAVVGPRRFLQLLSDR